MEAYERAVELDPQHVGALFRLGYWNDLRGNDDLALDYYEKAAEIRPLHTNALLNLGVLYEDRGDYERAAAHLRPRGGRQPGRAARAAVRRRTPRRA